MTDHFTIFTYILLLASFVILQTAAATEDDSRLHNAIATFDDEPDIADVQEQVLDHRDIDDDRPDRWTRRARISHLIPAIQAQGSWLDQRDQQNRFRENITADDDGNYARNYAQHNLHDDSRLRAIYSLRLTFDLSGLVFSGNEMTIQREVRNRWAMRDNLVTEVTDLYFARRRLQLQVLLLPDDNIEVAVDRHIEIEALTARIDALTGGWFRQQLQEK